MTLPLRLLVLAACAACLVSRAEMEWSTPEAEGISSAAIGAWLDACERELDAVHGFVIVRHGKTVAEGWWSPFTAERPHKLYSHSKAFTSTAVGLLVDAGKLDIDERLLDVFPDKAPAQPSEKLRALRIRDLLTMTTGMPYTDAERKDIAGDWVKLFLANGITNAPGTVFRYDSCASHVLAAVVERRSGEKLMDFLKTRFFDELGVAGSWCTTDPQGIACGGWGMNVTTRGLARFGQCYLQEGRWGSKQVLSKNWVRLASAHHTRTGRSAASDWGQGYGFQFWRCRHDCYRADGAQGQYTIVMPNEDAVVALSSGLGPMDKELDLVWTHLLPAMQAKPLPADPAAQKALADRCAKLALKTVTGAKTGTPALGKAFTLTGPKRRFGFRSARLAADGDGWTITLATPARELVIPVGYGSWRCGTARFEEEAYEKLGGLVGDQPTRASGAWTSPTTFRARVYLPDGTFRFDFEFAFAADGTLAFTTDLFGMGGGKWTLQGRPDKQPHT